MQRRELKSVNVPHGLPGTTSCLSCRGVNWNLLVDADPQGNSVASHAEAWIEILSLILEICFALVASHAEAWIEIEVLPSIRKNGGYVASHAEAWIEIRAALAATLQSTCCLSCRGVNWNFQFYDVVTRQEWVASHAEAWIEIVYNLKFLFVKVVASHAEAWIEINLKNTQKT